MKKIVLMVVAMLSMTMGYAENENVNTVQGADAYDMSVNVRRLAVTLGLTLDQMEAVEDIHTNFCKEMQLAGHAASEQREELMDKAIRKDLRYMHYVLNQKQYKNYVMLLNTTLVNRGLK